MPFQSISPIQLASTWLPMFEILGALVACHHRLKYGNQWLVAALDWIKVDHRHPPQRSQGQNTHGTNMHTWQPKEPQAHECQAREAVTYKSNSVVSLYSIVHTCLHMFVREAALIMMQLPSKCSAHKFIRYTWLRVLLKACFTSPAGGSGDGGSKCSQHCLECVSVRLAGYDHYHGHYQHRYDG